MPPSIGFKNNGQEVIGVLLSFVLFALRSRGERHDERAHNNITFRASCVLAWEVRLVVDVKTNTNIRVSVKTRVRYHRRTA